MRESERDVIRTPRSQKRIGPTGTVRVPYTGKGNMQEGRNQDLIVGTRNSVEVFCTVPRTDGRTDDASLSPSFGRPVVRLPFVLHTSDRARSQLRYFAWYRFVMGYAFVRASMYSQYIRTQKADVWRNECSFLFIKTTVLPPAR
jgi:hypothetical protein